MLDVSEKEGCRRRLVGNKVSVLANQGLTKQRGKFGVGKDDQGNDETKINIRQDDV